MAVCIGILLLVPHYLPGYLGGGPIRSAANLVGHLGNEFAFRILTRDRDLGDAAPYPGVGAGGWADVGAARVRYCGPRDLGLRALARTVRETPHDVLYLNSFFSPRFAIAPLVARRLGLLPDRPVIVAPRGEFSAGALALKAPKKRAWLRLGRALGVFDGVIWQATTEIEADDIRRTLGGLAAEVVVAPNLSAALPPAPPPHAPRAPGAPLRVIFLSRLSPKKNLDYALRVLAGVRVPVAFTICGPAEDAAHAAACRALAAGLPAHVTVDWRDAVRPEAVPGLMAAHDLFFLPTRGENFGHVIAEALGAGTPVLLADTTPWRDLARAGLGHDLPLSDPAAFVAAIEREAALVPGETAARRAAIHAHMRTRERESNDVEANRAMLRAAAARAPGTQQDRRIYQ